MIKLYKQNRFLLHTLLRRAYNKVFHNFIIRLIGNKSINVIRLLFNLPKGLAGQFVNAGLGSNGKLNSLTTLQVGEDSKIHSYEHIAQRPNQELRTEQTKNHREHEISESYFFATPSITREIEMDFERYF